MGISWRDDGTLPRPTGPREIADIVDGVEELRGALERAAFIAGLIDSGEFDAHGGSLVLALANAWGITTRAVRGYVQQARVSVSLNPQTRASVVASLVAELEAIRLRATRHRAYGSAVSAVMGKAKLFGLAGADDGGRRQDGQAAPAVPPWLRKGDDGGGT